MICIVVVTWAPLQLWKGHSNLQLVSNLSSSKTIIAPKTTTILVLIWSQGTLQESLHHIATIPGNNQRFEIDPWCIQSICTSCSHTFSTWWHCRLPPVSGKVDINKRTETCSRKCYQQTRALFYRNCHTIQHFSPYIVQSKIRFVHRQESKPCVQEFSWEPIFHWVTTEFLFTT